MLRLTQLFHNSNNNVLKFLRLSSNTTEWRQFKGTPQSWEDYRLLFATNPNPMWVYDLETLTFIEVNAAAVRHYGYSRAEFLVMTIADIRPAEDIPALKEIVSKVREKPDFVCGEWAHRKKDGTMILVEITASSITFAGRESRLILAHDVTERQQTEQELRENKRRLSSLIDSLPGIVFSSKNDSDWSMNYLSEGCFSLTGYKTEELLESKNEFSYSSIVHAEDLPRVLNEITAAIAKRQPYVVEYRIRTKSGQEKWLWEKGSGVIDPSGEVIGLEGFITDITEHKQTENLLVGQKQVLEMIATGAYFPDVLNCLTQWVEAQVSGMLCSILLVDQNGTNLLCSAAPSLPETYNRAIDGLLIGPTSGCCGTAAYFGKPVMVSDVTTDPLCVEFRDLALSYGLRTCYSMPIFSTAGNVLGTLTIYGREIKSPSFQDLQVIDVGARLAGIAIERQQVEERLIYDAFYDSLTDLPNRTLFQDRLAQAMKRYQRRSDKLFAVLFLDLDRFKVVNDSLGHAVGDRFLVEISHRLKTCLQPGDTIARLGGDEFAVLLEGIFDLQEAEDCASRIQQLLLTKPFNIASHQVFASVSIGITLSHSRYQQPEELLRDADIAMYQAKRQGRSCYRVFDPQMHTSAVSLLSMEQDLYQALERQEFRVYYQAIVSLATNQIVGFEALVRWQHPKQGLLLPAEFLSVAEESGLVVQMDWWVMKQACQQLIEWQTELNSTDLLTISVNLSSLQFSQLNMVARVAAILQETRLNPRCLKLEITENIVMASTKSATNTIAQLRDLQVQLNIDDFGTGYSSLSRLKSFPIDALKIDRSFVSQIGVDGESLEIIKTIITLARNLRMEAIAEGVETIEQAEQLKALGCQYAQGYLFSQPLPSEQARTLIASR